MVRNVGYTALNRFYSLVLVLKRVDSQRLYENIQIRIEKESPMVQYTVFECMLRITRYFHALEHDFVALSLISFQSKDFERINNGGEEPTKVYQLLPKTTKGKQYQLLTIMLTTNVYQSRRTARQGAQIGVR